ncbi:MAG: carboxylesterase/lipase family protein [Blastomonas sp.]
MDTTSGRVQGYCDRGVAIFKGIPYGESTGGNQRFLPPKPVAPHPGLIDATAFGPACPQSGSRNQAQSEDCLVLNIWTPQTGPGSKRPVMVYIHGGGFRTGSGSTASSDGTHLCISEDVVIVSLNHRLGPLGYLYLGDILGGEFETGNAGNLDLVLALEWVRDNIAQFGGDPDCVTVFGVSGGGKKISHLLAMPAAKGLFHRAIVMSGALSTAIERDAATAYSERFIAHLGMGKGDAMKLAALPADRLLQAVSDLSAAGLDPDGGYGGGGGPQPLVDGISLPEHPGPTLANGMSGNIPVMIGSTLDEPIAGYPGPEGLARLDAMSKEDIRKRLANGPFVALGDRTDTFIDHYRRVWPDISLGQLMVRIETAGSWRYLSNRLADFKASAGMAPCWVYIMTFAGGTQGGPRGAGHATDVPLLMGNLSAATDTSRAPWFAQSDGAETASRMMGHSWCSFARSGNPNNDLLPCWPVYTSGRHETMLLDSEGRVVADPFGDSRMFGMLG